MRRVLARLKEHWVRHLLAALQVAVGVAVVTAVFVDVVPVLRSGDTSHEADVFSAFYGSGTYPFYQSRSHVLSVDDVAYLESEVDTVVAASVYDNRFLALLRVDGDLFVLRSYTRVSPGFKEVAGVRLVAGRFFDDSDLRGEEPSVVVISSQLAEALFPGRSAIGEMINIRPEPEASRVAGYASSQAVSTEGAPGLDVRVIGVFEHPEGTPAYAGFFADGLREELLLPATGRPSRALAGVTTPGPGSAPADDGVPGRVAPTEERYPELYFRAAEGMGREAAAEVEALLGPVIESRRQALLDTAADQTESLVISPAVSGAQSMRQGQLTGSLILGAMGIAALIVSGFSILTTFLASVAERVRSIGLARALGATRLRIVREIVGEAVALAGAGGLIGVALSFPVRFVALRPLLISVDLPSAVDIAITIAAALLLAVGVGALAALYPGWTVARMSPAEAFYEE